MSFLRIGLGETACDHPKGSCSYTFGERSVAVTPAIFNTRKPSG